MSVLPALLLGVFGTAVCTAAPAELAPGTETELVLTGPPLTIKLYLPTNYTPTQKWPVIFFYHGMGGSPETHTIRTYAGGRDYLVVGMPYAGGSDGAKSAGEREAYFGREADNFRQALEGAARSATVDHNRVFLAGVSKGGWTVAKLGDRVFPSLAGIVILAAGRQAGEPPPNPALLRGKAVYVGAGENDPNLLPAVRAAELYRRSGATVTFEEYSGIGHALPDDAKLLSAWLAAHGPCAQQPTPAANAPAALRTLFKDQFADIMRDGDSARQYARLRELAGDPRLPLCGATAGSGLQTNLAALRAVSPVKEEWTAELELREILWQEAHIRRLEEFRAVRDALERLATTYPQTRYGRLAAAYNPYVAEAYRKLEEAVRQAAPASTSPTNRATAQPVKPVFPGSGNRSRGRVMHRDGNRVWWE